VTAVLLSVHVIAAIVLIGPLTAAASLFPRYARRAPAEPGALGAVALLHRISRGYAVVGLAVPVFGIGTAARMGVLGQPWLVVSMVLTAGAAALLAVAIVPIQRRVLAGLRAGEPAGAALPRLGMVTGMFALTWAVVVVLMIVRPGSSTGV
jgi:hypothetical protein